MGKREPEKEGVALGKGKVRCQGLQRSKSHGGGWEGGGSLLGFVLSPAAFGAPFPVSWSLSRVTGSHRPTLTRLFTKTPHWPSLRSRLRFLWALGTRGRTKSHLSV